MKVIKGDPILRSLVIKRTGQLPLQFVGNLVAEVESSTGTSRNGGDAPDPDRWHRLQLYRAESDASYVLAIEYRSNWRNEFPRSDCIQFTSPDDLAKALDEFNPLAGVVGFPTHAKYTLQQQRLMRRVSESFYAALDTLLAEAEIAVSLS